MQSKQFEMNKTLAIKAVKDVAAANAVKNYQIRDMPYSRRNFESSSVERYSLRKC